MAIELVIKIHEERYKEIVESDKSVIIYRSDVAKVFANSIKLPKGHGDLIDKSKIYKAIPAEEDNCTGMGMTLDEMDAYNEGIDAMYALVKGAKPIIEADKEVLDADSN